MPVLVRAGLDLAMAVIRAAIPLVPVAVVVPVLRMVFIHADLLACRCGSCKNADLLAQQVHSY